MDHLNISDFLSPVNLSAISHDEGYKEGQLGKIVDAYQEHFPDLDEAQIVLVGC
ncbi:MAG: arginase, partial [Chitinophagaceae bacterium]|nr:arginase [Chitinophagaceae bacterium]